MSSLTDNTNGTNFSGPVDPSTVFGPQRDELYIVLPITVIYTLIFITGMFGNIFTCIVIIRNKSMHTATNYYLFSLAISDLLLLVSGMPQEVYSIWSKWPYVFGPVFCLIRGLAAETSTNASVLTITLFTIERYLAICHPFVSHKMSKLSRAVKHVLMLWVVSFGLALPQALQFGITKHKGVTMCLQTRVIIEHSFEISTFFFFLAPMVLITVLYALIGIRLKRTNLSRQTRDREESEIRTQKNIRNPQRIRRKHSQSTRRVIKMLVAVVTAFFICWAPFHAQRLVAIYGTTENHMARSPVLLFVYSTLTYTSGIFYYMSTCINPIFYHIMSNKFREAFKNTVKQWCCRKSDRRAVQRSSYTAMALRNLNSNGTVDTGASIKSDLRNKDTGLGDNKQNWHVCNYCNQSVLTPERVNSCRIHSCSYSIVRHPQQNLVSRVNSDPAHSERTRSHFVQVHQDEKKTTFCSPSCCSGQRSIEDDSITPPSPEPRSRSSEENRTVFYPESENCIKEIKLKRILQRGKSIE